VYCVAKFCWLCDYRRDNLLVLDCLSVSWLNVLWAYHMHHTVTSWIGVSLSWGWWYTPMSCHHRARPYSCVQRDNECVVYIVSKTGHLWRNSFGQWWVALGSLIYYCETVYYFVRTGQGQADKYVNPLYRLKHAVLVSIPSTAAMSFLCRICLLQIFRRRSFIFGQ